MTRMTFNQLKQSASDLREYLNKMDVVCSYTDEEWNALLEVAVMQEASLLDAVIDD